MVHELPSKLLENAVKEFSRLPGIGRKTALRLVLYMLKQGEDDIRRFGAAMIDLKTMVRYCSICNNISDNEICEICNDSSRDPGIIMVVEDIRDVIAIENTHQYKGLYHILGGILSPIEGVGPAQLNLESLMKRVSDPVTAEIILALPTTMEGDTTSFYIHRKLEPAAKKVSVISRGVSIGGELEYTDEVTLGRSIVNRTPYSHNNDHRP